MYNLQKNGNNCNNKILKEDYMRRDSRRQNNNENKKMENKFIASGGIALLLIAAIIICIVLYARQLNSNSDSGITADKLSSLTQNRITDSNNVLTGETVTESASSSMGKKVEESKKETTNKTEENINNFENLNTKVNNTTTSTTKKNKTSKSTSSSAKEEQGEVVKKQLTFVQPVEGDIVKEFAKDNLIYSNTLEEWVTHLGVDIKADKTTVVKSAADGVVRSIKNDPRYGLTVVVNHDDGYQTVYANLLTAEFVVEGESVTQGQTIGTVGNTATFEISDESHLHFEILKDSVQVDPNIYIKGD